MKKLQIEISKRFQIVITTTTKSFVSFEILGKFAADKNTEIILHIYGHKDTSLHRSAHTHTT